VHFVLTRFNLGRGADEAWLRGRVELFERFTLPSMRSQTVPPDAWLLYCSENSPAWFRERIDEWAVPWLDVAWIPDRGEWQWLAQRGDVPWSDRVRELLDGSSDVVTSRLDNDDAVARDFCERVRRASRGRREFINFPNGAQYGEGRVYLRPDRSSPFLSLVEPAGAGVQTVFAFGHSRASKWAPIRQVFSHPMWLGVVHGENFLQSLSGFEVPPGIVLKHFDVDAPVAGAGVGRTVVSGVRFAAGVLSRRISRTPARGREDT